MQVVSYRTLDVVASTSICGLFAPSTSYLSEGVSLLQSLLQMNITRMDNRESEISVNSAESKLFLNSELSSCEIGTTTTFWSY